MSETKMQSVTVFPGGRLIASGSRLARSTAVSVSTLALALAIGAASVCKADAGGKPNEHASRTAKYLHAKAGDLLDVVLGDLHPTQAVLGYYEVFYKLGRYQAGKDTINKRFDDWCEANGQVNAAKATAASRLDDSSSFSCTGSFDSPSDAAIDPMKTVVIGRGGRPYLVDGHHTFTSFLESPDGGPNMHVRVRVLANLSTMGPDEFWREMEAGGWVWLRDENNQPITTDQLPNSLGFGNFRDDDYRSLVYFARDIAYKQNAAKAPGIGRCSPKATPSWRTLRQPSPRAPGLSSGSNP